MKNLNMYISTKTEVEYIYTQFFLYQRKSDGVQSDCRHSLSILTSQTSSGSMLLLVVIVYHRFSSKYTKNVNICFYKNCSVTVLLCHFHRTVSLYNPFHTKHDKSQQKRDSKLSYIFIFLYHYFMLSTQH